MEPNECEKHRNLIIYLLRHTAIVSQAAIFITSLSIPASDPKKLFLDSNTHIGFRSVDLGMAYSAQLIQLDLLRVPQGN